MGAVFLIPGFIASRHDFTPLDIFFDLFTFSVQYLNFLVLFGSVINLVVAAYPGFQRTSQGHPFLPGSPPRAPSA